MFTPQLITTYKTMMAAKKKFEVVFASSDRDQASFDSYYGDMPWAAIPYANRNAKEELSKKYKVRGIPSLVIVNKDGSTITTNGRAAISQDPKGDGFPWTPKTVSELLGSRFQSKNGEVGKDSLAGKHIALYFSAHWCPPCRKFTPVLIETYNAIKAKNPDQFEVIFVSSDNAESEFDEYFGEMPWLALPFSLRSEKAALSDRFGVSGIPYLVILDSEFNVVNPDGRAAVMGDTDANDKHTGGKFPWIPPVVPELDEAVGFINDTPTIAVLAEGCAEEKRDELMVTLNAAADKIPGAKGPDAKVRLAFAGPGSEIASRLRSMTNTKTESKDAPDIVFLNIPSGNYHCKTSMDVSVESMEQLVADFQASSLDMTALG